MLHHEHVHVAEQAGEKWVCFGAFLHTALSFIYRGDNLFGACQRTSANLKLRVNRTEVTRRTHHYFVSPEAQ